MAAVSQVVYKEKDLDAAPSSWSVEGNTSHSVQLTGLGKYVLYDIQVLAFTRIGDGRSSSPSILERTLDDGELAVWDYWTLWFEVNQPVTHSWLSAVWQCQALQSASSSQKSEPPQSG